MKALNQSSKVSIRTDDRGFLSLQYLVKTEDGKVCFVDYLVRMYVCTLTASTNVYMYMCVGMYAHSM